MINALAIRVKSVSAIAPLRIALFLVAVIAVGLGALLGAILAGMPAWGAWPTLIGFTGAVLVGAAAAEACYRFDAALAQRGRDLAAGDIYTALKHGDAAKPFCLYLRPFASTGAMVEDTLAPVRLHGGHLALNRQELEFEQEIERAVRPVGLLVALGEPLEHEGAGRIDVADSEWQDAIETLMDAARIIILLPSPRDGTLWEVDRLMAGGYLAKTVVIDPPNTASNRPDYDPAAEWNRIRSAFAEGGYTLPDDTPGGRLVHYGDGKREPASRLVGLNGIASMRGFVRAIVRNLNDRQTGDTTPGGTIS